MNNMYKTCNWSAPWFVGTLSVEGTATSAYVPGDALDDSLSVPTTPDRTSGT